MITCQVKEKKKSHCCLQGQASLYASAHLYQNNVKKWWWYVQMQHVGSEENQVYRSS